MAWLTRICFGAQPGCGCVAGLVHQQRIGRDGIVSVGAGRGAGVERRGRGGRELVSDGGEQSVGFTFNSRDFTGTNSWPVLAITAVAKPLARITSIERLGTNQVAMRFNTASNWTYVVQGLDGLPAGSAGGWSNLFMVAAKPFDDQALFVDGVTNRQRFYRLLLSQ